MRSQQNLTSNFARRLREKYGVSLWISGPIFRGSQEKEESSDDSLPEIVSIDIIVVPKEERGKGVGSKVMFELTNWADAKRFILALTPSTSFGESKRKLRYFYKKFGFVPNKNKNKDFRTTRTMIRFPVLEKK